MTEELDSAQQPDPLQNQSGNSKGSEDINRAKTQDQWNAWIKVIEESHSSAASSLEIMQEKTKLVTDLSATATSSANKVAEVKANADTQLKLIQEAQVESEKLRVEMKNIVETAKAEVVNIDNQKSRGQAASDDAVRLAAEMSTSKNTADTALATIAEALKSSQQSANSTKALADKAGGIESNISAYENRLKELILQSEQQLKTITGLLPGATSAGLASAFNSRAGTFNTPQKRWQWIFIASLLSLIALGATGLWHAITSHTVLSYDELVRLWLARLPVAGALLWLTLHAGRESALAKRLEEDYAYKSAIASSFEGFRQQMNEVGASAGDGTPLAKLCQDTLATIADPPGRIYDKHKLTVTPSQEVARIATAVAEAWKQLKP